MSTKRSKNVPMYSIDVSRKREREESAEYLPSSGQITSPEAKPRRTTDGSKRWKTSRVPVAQNKPNGGLRGGFLPTTISPGRGSSPPFWHQRALALKPRPTELESHAAAKVAERSLNKTVESLLGGASEMPLLSQLVIRRDELRRSILNKLRFQQLDIDPLITIDDARQVLGPSPQKDELRGARQEIGQLKTELEQYRISNRDRCFKFQEDIDATEREIRSDKKEYTRKSSELKDKVTDIRVLLNRTQEDLSCTEGELTRAKQKLKALNRSSNAVLTTRNELVRRVKDVHGQEEDEVCPFNTEAGDGIIHEAEPFHAQSHTSDEVVVLREANAKLREELQAERLLRASFEEKAADAEQKSDQLQRALASKKQLEIGLKRSHQARMLMQIVHRCREIHMCNQLNRARAALMMRRADADVLRVILRVVRIRCERLKQDNRSLNDGIAISSATIQGLRRVLAGVAGERDSLLQVIRVVRQRRNISKVTAVWLAKSLQSCLGRKNRVEADLARILSNFQQQNLLQCWQFTITAHWLHRARLSHQYALQDIELLKVRVRTLESDSNLLRKTVAKSRWSLVRLHLLHIRSRIDLVYSRWSLVRCLWSQIQADQRASDERTYVIRLREDILRISSERKSLRKQLEYKIQRRQLDTIIEIPAVIQAKYKIPDSVFQNLGVDFDTPSPNLQPHLYDIELMDCKIHGSAPEGTVNIHSLEHLLLGMLSSGSSNISSMSNLWAGIVQGNVKDARLLRIVRHLGVITKSDECILTNWFIHELIALLGSSVLAPPAERMSCLFEKAARTVDSTAGVFTKEKEIISVSAAFEPKTGLLMLLTPSVHSPLKHRIEILPIEDAWDGMRKFRVWMKVAGELWKTDHASGHAFSGWMKRREGK